jgi:hypothetical protein
LICLATKLNNDTKIWGDQENKSWMVQHSSAFQYFWTGPQALQERSLEVPFLNKRQHHNI